MDDDDNGWQFLQDEERRIREEEREHFRKWREFWTAWAKLPIDDEHRQTKRRAA